MTHPTGARINADLLRPLLFTSWRFYLLAALFGAVVLSGLVSWFTQMTLGFGISGIRWPVYWGFYVTNFVFWKSASATPAHSSPRSCGWSTPAGGVR